MAPETKKIATAYVGRQVRNLGQHVPKKSVAAAVKKVTIALEEVRIAKAEYRRAQG
jgi:hypothetical protein